MLLDNNGDAVFIYTPPSLRASGVSKARDPRHAAKMFKAAQADTTGRWAAFHFTSHDNPHLSTDALREITQDMSPDSYRKEILAEDMDIEQSWMVYGRFNQAVCRIPRFELSQQWPRYVGHDFGAANPAALFVAHDPATGYFYCYREYLPGSGRSTAQHVEEFKALTHGVNVIKRVGGNPTTEDEIRQGYTAHGWPIVAPRIKQVKPQIDKVLGLMALNKLFVFSDLTNYLNELNNCLWELDEENRPTDKIKDEARYHLCAAARYILSDFTPETVTGTQVCIKRSPYRFGG
jgi:phage terminase large subunit